MNPKCNPKWFLFNHFQVKYNQKVLRQGPERNIAMSQGGWMADDTLLLQRKRKGKFGSNADVSQTFTAVCMMDTAVLLNSRVSSEWSVKPSYGLLGHAPKMETA